MPCSSVCSTLLTGFIPGGTAATHGRNMIVQWQCNNCVTCDRATAWQGLCTCRRSSTSSCTSEQLVLLEEEMVCGVQRACVQLQ